MATKKRIQWKRVWNSEGGGCYGRDAKGNWVERCNACDGRGYYAHRCGDFVFISIAEAKEWNVYVEHPANVMEDKYHGCFVGRCPVCRSYWWVFGLDELSLKEPFPIFLGKKKPPDSWRPPNGDK